MHEPVPVFCPCPRISVGGAGVRLSTVNVEAMRTDAEERSHMGSKAGKWD